MQRPKMIKATRSAHNILVLKDTNIQDTEYQGNLKF